MWKCLFKILALRCEDKTLSTTETSLDNKTAIWENICLIRYIPLVIMCTLLLADVSNDCFTITQDIEKYKNIYYHIYNIIKLILIIQFKNG